MNICRTRCYLVRPSNSTLCMEMNILCMEMTMWHMEMTMLCMEIIILCKTLRLKGN